MLWLVCAFWTLHVLWRTWLACRGWWTVSQHNGAVGKHDVSVLQRNKPVSQLNGPLSQHNGPVNDPVGQHNVPVSQHNGRVILLLGGCSARERAVAQETNSTNLPLWALSPAMKDVPRFEQSV
eukprot:g37533.t1